MSNQFVEHVCFWNNEYKYIKIKNPRRLQSDNSIMKKDMQSRFSGLTQQFNLSYLLQKPKLSK